MNTNHLGYKLISGKLKENRNQSEQLNKFVAGFFDGDGMVTLSYDTKTQTTALRCQITQSSSNDQDYEMMRAIQSFYNIGTLRYQESKKENWNPYIIWVLATKDSKILFNQIGKHLILKRDHFLNMIAAQEGYRGEHPKSSLIKSIRENSREMSSKRIIGIKHISPAYLAGLVAADGHVDARFNKKQYDKKRGKAYTTNCLSLNIELDNVDYNILPLIVRDFGGYIVHKKTRDVSRWQLNLGKQNKKAQVFISKLMSYMCMQKKYDKLEDIYHFHKQLAETKRIEPDKGM